MALTKVFRIELTGGKDVEKDINSIKTAMSSMATAISKAKGELAQLVSTKADPGEISSLTAKIAELEAKMKSLSQERKKAAADVKTEAQVEKLLAEAKLKEAQATKAQEEATKARIASQIAQEKEIDRQIDREKKEQQELEKKKKILDGLPGSYNAIRNALNELRPLIQKGNESSNINFQGQNLNFEQAIAEYKRLSATEQEFRRQFTRDSTLVGEYASGIVDAFKRLNIDDIIKNQVTGAKEQISSLESKTQEMVVAYRSAQQQNISSTEQLRLEVNKISTAYDEAKARGSADLDALKLKLQEVQQAYHNAQQQGAADLNRLEKEIHDNVVETQNLQKAVAEAEVQLKGVSGVGQQITNSINQGFKNLKNSIAQFALTYVGFFAAFNQFRKAVELNAELSDSFAQLQIYLHGSKQDVDNLVESLKQIPTRTSLEHLVDISTVVAKKGVAKEEIAGVTQALDQLFIVLGKEVGDPHEAVSSLVKLVNVYSEDKHVTAKNIGDIGAAIQKLTSSGVATGDFLINFAERLAGVRGITGVSIQNVLGLGAALQELGQRSEVAGTAASQLVVKLFTDIPKYAGFAGKSVKDFTKTVTENPVEALVQLAQGLKTNKAGLDEVAQAFDQAGIHGARVLGVLGDIAGNADYMRKRIRDANAAFGDQASIVEANAIKQQTFAATLDLIKKKFELLGTSKGFQVTLSAIASAILFLINSIPTLITLGTLLAIGWAVQNKELVVMQARLFLVNAQLLAGRIALGLLTVVQTAYNGVLFITNGALTLVTRGLAFFGVTVKATAGPLGIILTVATLLAAAFAAFGRRLEASRANLSEYVRLQQINAEVSKKAAEATNEQISKLDGWIAVIKSAATSADTKRQALEKLIEINPKFKAVLQDQTIDLKKLDEVYKQLTESIRAKARAEAASFLSAEKQKNIVVVQTLRQRVEIEGAKEKGNLVNLKESDLTKEEINVLQGLKNVVAGDDLFGTLDKSFAFKKKDFDKVIGELKRKENEATDIYQDYLKVQLQAEADLKKLEEDITQPTAGGAESETVFQIFDRLVANNGTAGDFAELLKKIQAQKKATAVTSKEYQDLLALEKKVRDLIKPKAGTDALGRSPEKQKLDDRLKAIDAAITEQKNALDEQLAQGVISEREYYIQVRNITVNGEQQKINTILEFQQKYKKALAKFNGELTKDISEAEKKQIQAKREANQKLYDIDVKQLEINLRNEQLAAGRNKDLTQLNPELSNEDRIQSTIDYYDRLLLAQVVFNQKQSELEKKYGIKSVENAQKRKEEIEKIAKEIQDSEAQRPEAQIKDIQAAGDRQVREFNLYYSKLRTAILENDRITAKEKQRQLAELEKAEKRTILSAELAALTIEVKKREELLKKGLISMDEYLKAVEAQKKKAEELAGVTSKSLDAFDASFSGFIDAISNLTKLGDLGEKEIGNSGISIGYVIAQSWDIAKSALQGYYDAKEKAIEKDKQDHLDELDREKERVKARATSKAEEDTIDRQYEQKKKQIEKEAGEELKKQKKAEAKIALAAELANIAVQAAANPANAVSFGSAGILQFSILSALALGRYLLRVSEINKTQFGFGGYLKKKLFGLGGNANEVPVNGGVFGGRPHSQGGTDFTFNGQAYNAEVGEMNIIRTKDAPKDKTYTITGNHTQIASALNALGGGVSFQPGAKIAKYGMGGALGTQLKAPYFSAGAYLNGGNVVGTNLVSADVQELKGMVAQIASAVYATDTKEVQLNPAKVTKAQRKKIKDTTVGDI